MSLQISSRVHVMEKFLQFTQKKSVDIAAFILSFAVFGQVFFSSIVNVLSLDNRFVMLVFRLCLMIINVGYILFFVFQKKSPTSIGKSWINVIVFFWSLYMIRLFHDVSSKSCLIGSLLGANYMGFG